MSGPKSIPRTHRALRIWWLSVLVSALIFIVLYWIVPIFPDGAPMTPLAQALHDAAPVLALLALVPIAWGYQRTRARRRANPLWQRLEALRRLKNPDFEGRVAVAYRRQGYAVEELGHDGGRAGVDLVLRRRGERVLVQCRMWRSRRVGRNFVKHTYALAHKEGAAASIILTCGHFPVGARMFASGKAIELVDGIAVLELLGDDDGLAPSDDLADLHTSFRPGGPDALHVVADGIHYEPVDEVVALREEQRVAPVKPPPLCPRCETPMRIKHASGGGASGHSYWECTRDPACAGKRPI